jgi:hypothetical protein
VRGRRVPITPLIRARARELDVELRELSGEAEVEEVEFVPTQFGGENEEQEEQEIDDSGIFLDEEFAPRLQCKSARAPGLAVPAESIVVGVCVYGWSGDAEELRALTPFSRLLPPLRVPSFVIMLHPNPC